MQKKRMSDDQILALAHWIVVHGRCWKAALLHAWKDPGAGGSYHQHAYSSEIRFIRQLVGPSYILDLKSADILNKGVKVAETRGISVVTLT